MDNNHTHERGRDSDVHVHVHLECGEALAAITSALLTASGKDEIMASLDKIKDAVTANGSVIASAITLLQGLKAALDAAIAAGYDEAALDALSTELGTESDSLAAAVAANAITTTPPPVAAPTTTALTSSANPAPLASTVTLTATVTGASPTGTVSFLDGTTSLGVGTVAAGLATLDTSFTDLTARSLTAAYSGDAANAASVSEAYSQVISQ